MKNIYVKIIAAVSFVLMVVVNFLANSLPINNRSTGVISDAYPNLFAPAGITFSIWGLIYFLLGYYVMYQFVQKDKNKDELLEKINPLFIATSLANISWIFAWHYDYIGFSVIIMFALLFLLIKIADLLRKESFSLQENFFIKTPFSVYFGWITVATIANITVFLVSRDWDGFGITDVVWTSIVLLIGAFIGILRMNNDNSRVYGLVLVWAYLGILFKHVSTDGFGGNYPSVIATVGICIGLFFFFIGKLAYKK